MKRCANAHIWFWFFLHFLNMFITGCSPEKHSWFSAVEQMNVAALKLWPLRKILSVDAFDFFRNRSTAGSDKIKERQVYFFF